MNADAIISEFAELGVVLKADGERLRFFPRSAVTPELIERLKAHKADLLAVLGPSAPPVAISEPGDQATAVCRCGSSTWRDVPIHDGESLRRDCAQCKRFLDFPVWYGKKTGQKGQYVINY